MKILLLNPPDKETVQEFPDEEGNSYIDTEDFGFFPPLGLLYVLSSIEKERPHHEYFFKDAVAERCSYDKLEAYLKEVQPDIVGITSFTISLVDICRTGELVRKVCGDDVKICLGGHHPIAFPVEAAQLPQFDCIVVGEGEHAFVGLVDAWENNTDINKVFGVYTKEKMEHFKDKTIEDKRFLKSVSVPAAYVDDLTTIPIPNREYIRHIKYSSVVGVSSDLATIISTRGCPFLCTFCDVPYKKYRTRPVDDVLDEVEACMKMGYEEFHFYDDLFNIKAKKVIEFCDAVEARGLKFTWSFRGRANAVTEESLRRSKQAGCRMISFGVETGTNAGLKELKKGVTTEKFVKVFRWCREIGIVSLADFIIGFPFERTVKDIQTNLDFLISLDPDYAQIAVLMLLPNTPLYDEALEKGIVKPGVWEEFCLNPTPDFELSYWTEFHDLSTLVALQTAAYRKFYFRPKYILRSLLKTSSFYELKTKAKGGFKLFFSKIKASVTSE